MKKLWILFILVMVTVVTNAQGLVERYVRATEILQTNLHFIYQGTYTPVRDITYHEFSSDSLTWRKNFQEGDCYVRFANTTNNTTNPYTGQSGYHSDWWVFNFCDIGGGGSGGLGASSFDALEDTPNSKIGEAGKFVTVDSSEVALAYTPAADISLTSFDSTGFQITMLQVMDLTDTLNVHRTDINQNTNDIVELNDSIAAHRIDIDSKLEEETDPVYSQDSVNIVWFSDLDTLSFLRSYTETDPVFSSHTTFNISDGSGFLKNDGSGNWSYESVSSSFGIETVTQTSHGLSVGDWIKLTGGTYGKAIANAPINADVVGIVSEVINLNQFKYQYAGVYTLGVWTKGANYFLSPTVAGAAEISPAFEHDDVQVFLGTGIDSGILLEIDVGAVIDTTTYLLEFTETDPVFSAWDKDYNDLINKPILYSEVYNEVPTGILNEVNTEFVLTNIPQVGTVRVYLNGLRQAPTDDYSISGSTITFVEPPYSGDKILVDYKY